MKNSLVPVALLLTLATSASAQSINADMGTTFAAPSSTFGAAAGQPGTWNSIDASSLTPQALVDLTGAATPVTITQTSGAGYNFSFNNAGTFGDDELLLDDGDDPSPNSTWTIAGLTPGSYTVYTYAWAPDSATYVSGVSVNAGPTTNVGGAWAGVYSLGLTHAIDNVIVATGGTITVNVFTITSFATFNGLQIIKTSTPTTAFCFGDGTGTACPCANSGAIGNGCANSLNPSGAKLAAAGVASATLANDTWVLSSTGIPNGPGLYFQGTTQLNGGLGAVFGDGLRCVGGQVIRLGIVTAAGNASTYPSGATPPNNIPISQKGLIAAGDVRNYQLWYRDSGVFCSAAVFNLTNAVNVTWAP